MNVKGIKKPERRVAVSYSQQLGIQSFGHDNLYPQTMIDIISSSPTGGSCLERYITFIEGNGFREVGFSEYIVNKNGESADDILTLVSEDVGRHEGFALHVNYDIFGHIVELQNVPFMNCRLLEEDENGYISKIAVHPDWNGRKTRKGKVVKVDKENVDYIDVFNPNPNVVFSQIQAAGGIENYKGQILWVSLEGKYIYPTSLFDKIITELSVDEALANIKYRNSRHNFLLGGIMITKKGQSSQSIEDNNKDGNGKIDEDNGFSDALTHFQGDTKANLIMEIEVNSDEEIPKFIQLSSKNYDKDFTVTESSTVERIYCAFNQEPWYCIRIGKVGFGGDVMENAFEVYNSFVNKKQRAIERAFDKIFKCWYETPNPSMNFSIQPLKYIRNAATTPNN